MLAKRLVVILSFDRSGMSFERKIPSNRDDQVFMRYRSLILGSPHRWRSRETSVRLASPTSLAISILSVDKAHVCLALVLAITSLTHAQGFAPHIAVKKMQVARGLRVVRFASEPQVRQPILVKCDDRGRLWTIQYLQYPNPAGLKRVKVDRWSRTVYDRMPKPPPHGPRGADRITILDDTDGDGRADVFKDFVRGLNLCTGLAFGHGGVFVMQAPYLLFYPDRNRDDVPDGPPQVLLTGFGLEDAQSLSNHLTWGPDGWLYGVNGSTTTCRIRGIEFQQGCWRYHPRTKAFDLFCEGGGNTFGLTFDRHGELFYSTNGGPFVHAVQGGYFYKSFGKHGPLHNLYAYGHFGPLQRDRVPGGPPTGGTIYLGGTLPSLERTFLAGNFLGHSVSWWKVTRIPGQATVKAKFGGVLLDARDRWFCPTDLCVGPRGAIYVADFHDQRTSHPDPDARWDRSNGRIYRIEMVARERRNRIPVPLHRLSSLKLVKLLGDSNRWFADRARVELATRRDPSVYPQLKKMALQTKDESAALQGLWALYVSGGWSERLALRLLDHPSPHVRRWTVRLLGDARQVGRPIANRLLQLAQSEESVVVRSQLAASARRLSCGSGLPIIVALLKRGLDRPGSRVAWLAWWAIESWVVSDTPQILAAFAQPGLWQQPLFRRPLQHLVRRFAAEGNKAGYDACFKLIRSAPADTRGAAHRSLATGLRERRNELHGIGLGGLYRQYAARPDPGSTPKRRKFSPLTGVLKSYVLQQWKRQPASPFWIGVALQSGIQDAQAVLFQRLSVAPAQQRVQLLGVLGRHRPPVDRLDVIFKQLDHPNRSVRLSAIDLLGRFDSATVSDQLIRRLSKFTASGRSRARGVLLSRKRSANAFLKLVEKGMIAAKDVPLNDLRRVALHKDPLLDAMVKKIWGRIGPGSSEEKLAAMRRFNNDLRGGAGDFLRGKQLFRKHCAICHKLFGEGNKIGPDLTNANRRDRSAMLAALVDPSAVVRRQYLSYVVVTKTGRVVTGLIAAQDAASVTLLDAKNRRSKISRSQISSIRESPVSLMPERQLDQLRPRQVRDLFRYLQSNGK